MFFEADARTFEHSKSESLRDVSVIKIGDTFPTVFRRLKKACFLSLAGIAYGHPSLFKNFCLQSGPAEAVRPLRLWSDQNFAICG